MMIELAGATGVSTSPAGRAWRDSATAPLMVELPGGVFTMGENVCDRFANDTERPAHRVLIAAFSLGRFPVTVEEYRAFRPEHGAGEPGHLPVVRVSWTDAYAYCEWLSTLTGHTWRLPSEAEWEYACRAGSRDLFSSGSRISPELANFLYDENGMVVGTGRRSAVGHYPANAFGFCDMHGNVCEWVADSWHANYLGAPGDGRAWIEPQEHRRVVRGGAWDYLPRLLRSACRDWRPVNECADNVGFRVAA